MTKDAQIKKLKQLCRWQFLTLGFYASDHNYEESIHNPLTNRSLLHIIDDHGMRARESTEMIEQLGFDLDEIRNAWPGIRRTSKEACV